MRGARLRAGKLGAVVGVVSLFPGCNNDDYAFDASDAGADAAVGFLSAETRGRADGSGTGDHDTQDLSVHFDTDGTADHLSVGLDSDAGTTTAPATSEPTTSPGLVETSVPSIVSSSGESETTVAAPSDEPTGGVDTTSPPETTRDVDTTPAPAETTEVVETTSPAPTSDEPTTDGVDTTSAPASSDVGTSSTGETEGELPPLEVSISTTATWVDLPATLSASLPEWDVPIAVEWSIISAPNGSGIDGLQAPTERSVTFVPDVAGTYTLNLHLEAGARVSDIEASVSVAYVDVGILEVNSWIDGAYSYEPKMVPSDGSSGPLNVGCSYNSWEFRDFVFWRDSLEEVTRSIGFRYSDAPADPTLFAYVHQRDIDIRATQVATVKSDCEGNRPVDLELGHFPTFSPASKQLARIRYTDGTFLLSSPIDINHVVYPSASNPQTCDWLDETSIVWNGNFYDGNFDGPGVGVSSTLERGSTTVLLCTARGSLFDWIDRVAVADGGLLVLSYGQLWFLPMHIDANGKPFAACDAEADGNILVASSVADFEVAPDRRSLALITQEWYQDVPYAYLGLGPVDVPFEPEAAGWRAFEIGNPFDYYTGLHWIADAQQLVWTAVEYSSYIAGAYEYIAIYGSSIHKINADGSAGRVLASRGVREAEDNGVITTGPISLPYDTYIGGLD